MLVKFLSYIRLKNTSRQFSTYINLPKFSCLQKVKNPRIILLAVSRSGQAGSDQYFGSKGCKPNKQPVLMRTDQNKPIKYRNTWNRKLQIRVGNIKYPQHTNHQFTISTTPYIYHKMVPALVQLRKFYIF